jgi:hypothetical protein
MQKVKRKQILKPVLKSQPLPPGPFPGTAKKAKKKSKMVPGVAGLEKGKWNRRLVDNVDLTSFLNAIHQENVCPMHVNIIPVNIIPAQGSTADLLDVVFFVPGPQ